MDDEATETEKAGPWDMPKAIGRNVRDLRIAAGWDAKEFGERMQEILGKPWKRQTVSALEVGDRAMTATDVAALAHVLGTTPAQLFTPPVEVDFVQVGTRIVPREDLAARGVDSVDAESLANIESDLTFIWKRSGEAEQDIRDAREVMAELQDQIKDYREIGKPPRGVLARLKAKSAQLQERVRRSDAEWKEFEDENNGESK